MTPALAMKAARLPVEPTGLNTWRVQGSSGVYEVTRSTLNAKKFYCECDAASFGKTCSHVVAVRDNRAFQKEEAPRMSEPQEPHVASTALAALAPRSIAEVTQVAHMFAKSGFFKDGKSEAEAFAKIWAGQELGLGPMAAMSQIHIVDGKACLDATLVGAMIKRSGRYDYRIKTSTDDLCEIEFFERGKPVGESSFSIEDAGRANLRGKTVWKSYPKAMCRSRALTQGARMYCPDVFNGAVYTPDEIETIEDVKYSVHTVEPEQKKSSSKSESPEIAEKKTIVAHIYSACGFDAKSKDMAQHKALMQIVSDALGLETVPQNWTLFKIDDLRRFAEMEKKSLELDPKAKSVIYDACPDCGDISGRHHDSCPHIE